MKGFMQKLPLRILVVVLLCTFSVNILIPVTAQDNQPPTIDGISAQVVEVGQAVEVAINASDPDGDAITVTSLSDNPAVANAVPSTAQAVTVTGAASGSATITVTVDDGRGGVVSTTFSVTVNPRPNQLPMIGNVPAQVVEVGQAVEVAINASDPDGDAVTISALSDKAAMASVAQSTAQAITVMGVASGSATITVTADDGRGGVVSTSFTVTVNATPTPPIPINNPPIIHPLATQTIAVGQYVVVVLNISDPDGDPVTVSASSDNEGVATVVQTATSASSLLVTSVAAGTANIALTVSDDKGGITNATFMIIVSEGTLPPPDPSNQPPVIAPLNPQIVAIGQSVIVPVGYSDPDGDAVTLTLTSDNPSVATVSQSTALELTVVGVSVGSANITVTVSDGRGGITSTSYVVTVNPPPNQPPIIDPIALQTVAAGQSVDVAVNISDPDGDVVTVSSVSDNPAAASVTLITLQTLTISGVAPGSATVTVMADDGHGGNVSVSFSVVVTFVFAAGGDIGASPRADASLRAIVPSGASFFLALGDLDYDQTPSDAAWCDYVKARVGDPFPFEVLTGNHEEGSASSPGPNGYVGNHAACLPDYFGAQPVIPGTPAYPANYYFDYPQSNPIMRVIMVSANLKFDGVQYNFNQSEQTNYTALAARIDEAKQAGMWVVVGMHKNCLSTGQKTCEIGPDLMNLLIAKQVDLVLQGHDHNYQRSKQIGLGGLCVSVTPGSYDPTCIVDDGSDNLYTSGAGTVFVIDGVVGRCCYNIQPNDTEAGYFVTVVGVNGVPMSGIVTYTVSTSRIDVRVVNAVGAWGDSFSIVRGGA